MLKAAPERGELYRPKAKDGARRVLLARTRYHVDYAYEAEQRRIGELAIWSCLRGRPPGLQHARQMKKTQ
ncbi:hypothetical protein WMF31_31660 [Sorangium sp. So ce1036]|uniref:hypothetical protein n=1 Tax=Sorangium sp. So ce1036 TaxID=3133328 RepID=UPI003F0E48CD